MFEVVTAERRAADRIDRRRNSRNGRRSSDPRFNWSRVAWLFAAYATYLSIRSIPVSLKRLVGRREIPNV